MSRIQEGVEEQKVRHSRAKGQRGMGMKMEMTIPLGVMTFLWENSSTESRTSGLGKSLK